MGTSEIGVGLVVDLRKTGLIAEGQCNVGPGIFSLFTKKCNLCFSGPI